jgi:hypothetical protein
LFSWNISSTHVSKHSMTPSASFYFGPGQEPSLSQSDLRRTGQLLTMTTIGHKVFMVSLWAVQPSTSADH